MKSYLCLLLLAFISCNIFEKKTDEIVLKDFIHDLFEKLVSIIENCGYDDDCIEGQYSELTKNFSPEQFQEYENFIQSPECRNECIEIFGNIFDEEFTEYYCNGFCQSNIYIR